jgi:cytochrome c2
MGNYDALKDLEFVRDAFNGQTFYYAPHADVVMKALVGEAYKTRGDEVKAKANFEAALAVPKPAKAGERAGRDVLDNLIRTRLNGGDTPIGSGVFSGCHSCHLNAPDKLLR